jgi:trimethylamine--corrinoid protein Co-methyltransferase
MRSEGNCRIDSRPLSAKEVVMLGLREILTERQKKQIFQSAIVLLEKIGYLCNHDETLGYFREAGCRIGRELDKPRKARRVLFTEEIVADALEKAPSGFAIYPTSPGYEKLEFLSGKSYFVSQGGDYVWDYRTHELRPARAHDHVAMSRLIDACDNIEGCFPAVYWFYDLVPQDQYDRYGIWDIFMSLECLHCGKPKFDVYSTATATEVPTFLRTWQLCAGGEDAFRAKPCGSLFIAPTSPFFLEGRIDPEDPWGHADSLVLMAKAGAPINIEPCGNLGMSGPVTVAGLVAQSIAEFLGMNVAIQSISPGNPVMMNDYTGSIDMATGQKQEVRPEANLVHLGLTEMTHYMGVPISTVNCSGSIEADAQVGWESMAIILSQYLAGTDMIGSFGGLGSDDVFDPRALLMANEMAGWVRHFVKGFEVNEETIPLDLMVDLGPAPMGGNFLATDHTLRRYRKTMWQPSKLTNSLARDAWVAAGKAGLNERAEEMIEEVLAAHEPGVPESQQQELRDLIAEVLEREGVKGDEAKEIMDLTYWQG